MQFPASLWTWMLSKELREPSNCLTGSDTSARRTDDLIDHASITWMHSIRASPSQLMRSSYLARLTSASASTGACMLFRSDRQYSVSSQQQA